MRRFLCSGIILQEKLSDLKEVSMYVCICRSVTTGDIERLLAEGTKPEKLAAKLKEKFGPTNQTCSKCLIFLKQELKEKS